MFVKISIRLHCFAWRCSQFCRCHTVWMGLNNSESPFGTGVVVTENWSEINGHQLQATIFDLLQATNSSKGIYSLYPSINLDGLNTDSKLILILELMSFWVSWWSVKSKYQKPLLLFAQKKRPVYNKEYHTCFTSGKSDSEVTATLEHFRSARPND